MSQQEPLAARSAIGYALTMKGSSPSWFAILRRDRGLFALVSALAVLLGLLQPVAAAQNARFAELFIICSDGYSPSAPADHQPKGPDCPLCPAGHLCGGLGTLATPADVPGLAPLTSISRQRPPAPANGGLFASGSEAPPSIRAPPFSA